MAAVDWIWLASDVQVDNVGAVNIRNAGWIFHRVEGFPAHFATIGVAWSLRSSRFALPVERDFAIDVVDAADISLAPNGKYFASGQFRSEQVREDRGIADSVIVMGGNINNVTFPAAGFYFVTLRLNGAEVGRYQFEVGTRGAGWIVTSREP